MNRLNKKIRLIFIPFLTISIAFIGVYTLLDWFFVIKIELIKINNVFWHVLISLILSWIPILIWLRPRTRLLDVTTRRKKPYIIIQLFACYLMVATTSFAQYYLVTTTGKLTKLSSINQLDINHPTMYYEVEHQYADTDRVGTKSTSYISHDKGGNHIQVDMFCVCPLYNSKQKETIADSIAGYSFNVKRFVASKGKFVEDKTKDSLRLNQSPSINYPKAWLGIHYSSRISTQISQEEQLIKQYKFYDRSERDFKLKNSENFVYLRNITNDFSSQKYIAAAIDTKLYNNEEPPLLLEPEFNSFDHRSGPSFECACGSFLLFAFLAFIILVFQPLDEEKLAAFIEKQNQKMGVF